VRAVVLFFLAFLPAVGLAQNSSKAMADASFDGAAGGVTSFIRSEKPKRGLDLHDNLNPWKPGLGLGAQFEVARNWRLRVDLDRYRPKFPGANGRENLDTVMLGLQYSLGGD
jgi:hypothetical protein